MAHKTGVGHSGGTYHPSAVSVDDGDAGDTEAQSLSSTEELSSSSEGLSSSVYDETNQQFLIRGLAEKRKAKMEQEGNRQEDQQEQQEGEERQEEQQENGAMTRQTTPPGKKRKRSGGMRS